MSSEYFERSVRGSARGGVGGQVGAAPGGSGATVAGVVVVEVLVVDVDDVVVRLGAAALDPGEQLAVATSAAAINARVSRTMPC